jgi:hypothetical protein
MRPPFIQPHREFEHRKVLLFNSQLSDLPDQSSSLLRVPRGQMTFDSEGLERPSSRFFSRRASIPSSMSGITIGRGFDLGQWQAADIRTFMHASGFSAGDVSWAVGAAGLKGRAAHTYLSHSPGPTISLQQQRDLFMQQYDYMERDVLRISQNSRTVALYGKVDWNALDPQIKELVVDLRFRGDFTPRTRERIQPILVNNDREEMRTLLNDSSYWLGKLNVPRERYHARAQFLD